MAGMVALLQQFGENVRQARHEHGWTQEELSARTDLAVVQVSRIERGKREIRLSTLVRLVDALDVAPDVLLRGVLKQSADPSP
jgi:transcriptional regulator with XRE-family HTH domain